jgi:hypothetical protein
MPMSKDNDTLRDETGRSMWPIVVVGAAAALAVVAYMAIRRNRAALPEVNSLLDFCEGAVNELELRLDGQDTALAG